MCVESADALFGQKHHHSIRHGRERQQFAMDVGEPTVANGVTLQSGARAARQLKVV
jgi:hypothetical protein